jgi:1-acyl-sn-glycerol-3-phosphate acyltransferase
MGFLRDIGNYLSFLGTFIAQSKYLRKIKKLRESGDYKAESELIGRVQKEWVGKLLKRYDIDLDVQGKENLPEGPCVFIPNHQSYVDVPALMYATGDKQIGFIAKDEFKKVPLLSNWIIAFRGLFIKRGNARQSLQSINEAIENLKLGFSIAIFPEGKRGDGREVLPFKPGSFKLATRAGVPVVPVAIDGTYKLFEEGKRIATHSRAKVTFLTPIETANMTREEKKELHKSVESDIREVLKNSN